ncbi:uncharacterized protein LOC144578857 [Callithrix jacchus]
MQLGGSITQGSPGHGGARPDAPRPLLPRRRRRRNCANCRTRPSRPPRSGATPNSVLQRPCPMRHFQGRGSEAPVAVTEPLTTTIVLLASVHLTILDTSCK